MKGLWKHKWLILALSDIVIIICIVAYLMFDSSEEHETRPIVKPKKQNDDTIPVHHTKEDEITIRTVKKIDALSAQKNLKLQQTQEMVRNDLNRPKFKLAYSNLVIPEYIAYDFENYSNTCFMNVFFRLATLCSIDIWQNDDLANLKMLRLIVDLKNRLDKSKNRSFNTSQFYEEALKLLNTVDFESQTNKEHDAREYIEMFFDEYSDLVNKRADENVFPYTRVKNKFYGIPLVIYNYADKVTNFHELLVKGIKVYLQQKMPKYDKSPKVVHLKPGQFVTILLNKTGLHLDEEHLAESQTKPTANNLNKPDKHQGNGPTNGVVGDAENLGGSEGRSKKTFTLNPNQLNTCLLDEFKQLQIKYDESCFTLKAVVVYLPSSSTAGVRNNHYDIYIIKDEKAYLRSGSGEREYKFEDIKELIGTRGVLFTYTIE